MGPNHASAYDYNSYVRQNFDGKLTGKVYLSFWIRYSWGTVQGQIKTWRIMDDWNEFTTHVSNFQHRDVNSYYFQRKAEDVVSTVNFLRYPEQSWVLVEVQAKQSSGTGVADGSWEVWRSNADGTVISKPTSIANIKTRGSGGQLWNQLMLGQYVADGATTIYYDDVYVDNSWARVVLGDKPVYADCSIREIQIPTSWSINSITLRVNKGSFSSGSTAYLYVIDENGNISNSKAVVIGSSETTSADTTPPNQPTGINCTIISN